jgi:hypothetical protein
MWFIVLCCTETLLSPLSSFRDSNFPAGLFASLLVVGNNCDFQKPCLAASPHHESHSRPWGGAWSEVEKERSFHDEKYGTLCITENVP